MTYLAESYDAALRENVEQAARIAALEAALREIDAVTYTDATAHSALRAIDKIARAALAPAPGPLMAFTPRTLIDVVSDIEDLKGIHLDMTHEQLDSLYDRQFERHAALAPAPAPADAGREPLGKEFAEVLEKHRWDLYAGSPATPADAGAVAWRYRVDGGAWHLCPYKPTLWKGVEIEPLYATPPAIAVAWLQERMFADMPADPHPETRVSPATPPMTGPAEWKKLADHLESQEPASRGEAAAALREAAERCVQLDIERAAWQRWTEAAEQRAGRLEKAIRDYLAGDYDHPDTHRPMPCQHGVEYYHDCRQCDEAHFLAALAQEGQT